MKNVYAVEAVSVKERGAFLAYFTGRSRKNSFHFDEIKIFATEPAKGLLEF
jgi:hypothetical protein